MNNGIAGYLLNYTSPGYQSSPIFCSIKSLQPPNGDDVWTVCPGFKFIVFDGENYQSQLFVIDNTNGKTMMPYQNINLINRAQSVRVYFNNAEVRLDYLS